MDEVVRQKCCSALGECEKHRARIESALQRLTEFFPLTESVLNALDDEYIAVVDQFLYRFAKLQDCIGLRLIPPLYMLLEDDSAVRPFIDVLNRLEKLGVLTSVKDWQYFRVLRNSLAHEYPERAEDVTNAINALYSSWPCFRDLYLRLKETADHTL
ncbi:MAG: hypothetical protein P1P60_00990 [Treponema phagedenis]|uniref:hypothetical protein n=1 Tax=Treponema phagedenis TaxID=162 RepID=UPI003133FBC3